MSRDAAASGMEFLGRPASHGGAPVTRIDTHAASVFLAGERALKIKRAVRFPFLDYSTLEKRKAPARRRSRSTGRSRRRSIAAWWRSRAGRRRLAIGGSGEPVEWAVEMRRFDETKTLDHLAERGEIDERLADALGRAVAKAHAAAPVGGGFVEELDEVIAQNDAELSACRPVCAAAGRGAERGDARGLRARAAAAHRARERDGCVRALPWRSASRQYRACSTASRRCSTPSSSIPRSRPATCSTISLSC